MQVLGQVMTLFLLMMCGLVSIKTGIMSEKGVSGLNALVLWFAQPCLIVAKLQTDAEMELVRELTWVFGLTCLIMALCGLVGWLLFRREKLSRRGVLLGLSMCSNCGFMGYPVITAAMGEGALIYAVMYVAAFNLMSWTLGAMFYAGKQGVNWKKILLNPSLLAVAAGLALFFTGVRLPAFLGSGIAMLGNTTTPLAMFVVGARLSNLKLNHLRDGSLLTACALRLVIFPLLTLFLLRLTGLPDRVINALFLCTAMPGAALIAMQAELYHADVALASRSVALSTALSMATVPLLLLLIA